jgi:hypothetical protein
MLALGIDQDTIEDGKLAVSETSTNVFRHAKPTAGLAPITPPELWAWAITDPSPQLVVSVFDDCVLENLTTTNTKLLDECGKGLRIVSAVTTHWACRRTRSRLARPTAHGKAVRFHLPLSPLWPGTRLTVHPRQGSQALQQALTSRGIEVTGRCDDQGISLVEVGDLHIWVTHSGFAWQTSPGDWERRPLIDLQETVDTLIEHLEHHAAGNTAATR